METWQIILIVLVAVWVGLFIPVLLMAAVALSSMRRRVSEVARKADPALDDIQVVARRMRSLTRGIEGSEARVDRLVEVLLEVGDTLKARKSALDVGGMLGATVGPALVAFFRSLTEDAAPDAALEPLGQPGESLQRAEE